MKRSFGPRKTASKLSESVHRQLNRYSLAASAAGMGVLVLTQPAEAKIVYTPAHVVIGSGGHYGIDFNHDGITDVLIEQVCDGRRIFCDLFASGSGIVEGTQGKSWAAALRAGAGIGHTDAFHASGARMDLYDFRNKRQYGYWTYFRAHYLGVVFQISGKRHFGWARLTHTSAWGGTLTGYDYETIPNKSIIAGKTKGPAVEAGEEDFSPGASLTNSIPDAPQSGSLGVLALGAQGVPLWRRKENESVVQGN